MLLWILFMAIMLFAAAAAVYFLVRSVHGLGFVAAISKNRRVTGWLLSTAVVLLPAVLLSFILGIMNSVIIYLHLTLAWLLTEGIRRISAVAFKRNIRNYLSAAAALILTAAYLAVGWFQAFSVRKTTYTVTTDKNVGSLRVALLADSHVGTTFDGKGLEKYIDRIQSDKPDVVVIVGDFVDESTSKEDMIAACASLKSIEAPYGTYFVFGNHDKGRYSAGRGYSGDDLAAELGKNGVTVLTDETKLIDDRFYLVGRNDASEELDFSGSRAGIDRLMSGLEADKFSIILDHQPHDYDAEAAAGADLVLSGHTHGGQMIPLVQLMKLFHLGGNDAVYGLERRKNTDFIVTSGISDWALKFKTGCFSEYVIIEITGNDAAARSGD